VARGSHFEKTTSERSLKFELVIGFSRRVPPPDGQVGRTSFHAIEETSWASETGGWLWRVCWPQRTWCALVHTPRTTNRSRLQRILPPREPRFRTSRAVNSRAR